MKIRGKFNVMSAISLIPVSLGLALITNFAMRNDVRDAESLVAEYTGGIASGLSSFFAGAQDAAAFLANMQGRLMLEWSEARDIFEDAASISPCASATTCIDSEGYVCMSGAGNPFQGGRRAENDADPNSTPISAAGMGYFRALVSSNARGEFSDYGKRAAYSARARA